MSKYPPHKRKEEPPRRHDPEDAPDYQTLAPYTSARDELVKVLAKIRRRRQKVVVVYYGAVAKQLSPKSKQFLSILLNELPGVQFDPTQPAPSKIVIL